MRDGSFVKEMFSGVKGGRMRVSPRWNTISQRGWGKGVKKVPLSVRDSAHVASAVHGAGKKPGW